MFRIRGGDAEKMFQNYGESGTRYKDYGTKRDGIASVLDAKKGKRMAQEFVENVGGGAYHFKLTKEDGSDIDGINDTPLNFDGKLYYPHPVSGVFTIWDETAIEIEKEKFKQREETISDAMEYVLTSNGMAKALLGNVVYAQLEAKQATPEHIMNYSPQSVQFSEAMTHLRKAVREKLPIIERASKKSDIKE
jgi:hypothetical protein